MKRDIPRAPIPWHLMADGVSVGALIVMAVVATLTDLWFLWVLVTNYWRL